VNLEGYTIDAKTATFAAAPTCKEHNELLQDLTLPTILAIPTPSERVVIPKLRRFFISSLLKTKRKEKERGEARSRELRRQQLKTSSSTPLPPILAV